MVDAGIDQMTEQVDVAKHLPGANPTAADANLDMAQVEREPAIETLDGEEVDDELAQDELNYRILLNKIDLLLDQLKLDA